MTSLKEHLFTASKPGSAAWKLRRFEHAPSYLQGNPYLHSGYRGYLSTAECMASIFKWTNETVNIWSHLLGFCIFAGFLIQDIVVVTPTLGLTPGEIFTLVYFVLGIMFTLGSSVVYHTFNCRSEAIYEKLLKWDTSAIIVANGGIYAVGLHTSLACHTQWRVFYEFVFVVMLLLILGWYTTSTQKSSEDHKKMVFVLGFWFTIGIIPQSHCVFLEGGFHEPGAQIVVTELMVYYCVMAAACLSYVTRYPEKCCPGKVDYFGSSHQLWHFFLVAGFSWWHQMSIWSLERRYARGC